LEKLGISALGRTVGTPVGTEIGTRAWASDSSAVLVFRRWHCAVPSACSEPEQASREGLARCSTTSLRPPRPPTEKGGRARSRSVERQTSSLRRRRPQQSPERVL